MIQFNFKTIAEQYPKAFEILKEWYTEDLWFDHPSGDNGGEEVLVWDAYKESGHESALVAFNPRDLDAFFDEQNILGAAQSILNANGDPSFKAHIWYVDENGYDEIYHFPGHFQTRTDALIALWTKQFSLLEQKLTKVTSS